MNDTLHRKRRTRAHVIADISANHAECIALAESYSVERIQKDYGFDLSVATYSGSGFIENGAILMQLKATESDKLKRDADTWPVRLMVSDLNHWLVEPYPVVLVYYHATHRQARWLYVQRDLKNLRLGKSQKSTTVRLPNDQRLNRAAMRRFRQFKDRVLAQADGVITHD